MHAVVLAKSPHGRVGVPRNLHGRVAVPTVDLQVRRHQFHHHRGSPSPGAVVQLLQPLGQPVLVPPVLPTGLPRLVIGSEGVLAGRRRERHQQRDLRPRCRPFHHLDQLAQMPQHHVEPLLEIRSRQPEDVVRPQKNRHHIRWGRRLHPLEVRRKIQPGLTCRATHQEGTPPQPDLLRHRSLHKMRGEPLRRPAPVPLVANPLGGTRWLMRPQQAQPRLPLAPPPLQQPGRPLRRMCQAVPHQQQRDRLPRSRLSRRDHDCRPPTGQDLSLEVADRHLEWMLPHSLRGRNPRPAVRLLRSLRTLHIHLDVGSRRPQQHVVEVQVHLGPHHRMQSAGQQQPWQPTPLDRHRQRRPDRGGIQPADQPGNLSRNALRHQGGQCPRPLFRPRVVRGRRDPLSPGVDFRQPPHQGLRVAAQINQRHPQVTGHLPHSLGDRRWSGPLQLAWRRSATPGRGSLPHCDKWYRCRDQHGPNLGGPRLTDAVPQRLLPAGAIAAGRGRFAPLPRPSYLHKDPIGSTFERGPPLGLRTVAGGVEWPPRPAVDRHPSRKHPGPEPTPLARRQPLPPLNANHSQPGRIASRKIGSRSVSRHHDSEDAPNTHQAGHSQPQQTRLQQPQRRPPSRRNSRPAWRRQRPTNLRPQWCRPGAPTASPIRISRKMFASNLHRPAHFRPQQV